jgi:hypothetical protein
MSSLLIFNFDCTSNEPSYAEQSINAQGTKKDDNITNIVKFHLLCGGNLKVLLAMQVVGGKVNKNASTITVLVLMAVDYDEPLML